MAKKDLQEMQKMMMLTFNDGFEQVIMPWLEKMEARIKDELREEFKKGQKSLSNRMEEMEVDMSEMRGKIAGVESNMEGMNGKMDLVLENNKDYGRRLDEVERIVKAN